MPNLCEKLFLKSSTAEGAETAENIQFERKSNGSKALFYFVEKSNLCGEKINK